MEKTDTPVFQTVGIIGGGKVGLHLLDLFAGSSFAHVVYVVDRDSAAPAMLRAQRDNLGIFTDIDQAFSVFAVDFIFEVTGSTKVADLIKGKLENSTTELITHEMAYIILQVVEQRDQATKSNVIEEILGIRTEIRQSLGGVQQLVAKIKDISEEMSILALNARIEAARLGEQGLGFGVVAQKMTESVGMVQAIMPEIAKVSGNVLSVSDKIENSLSNLR